MRHAISACILCACYGVEASPSSTFTPTDKKDLQAAVAGLHDGSYNGYPVESWNTGSIFDMSCLFKGATRFNGPIGTWNTARVKNFSHMFSGASAFNSPIGTWNTIRASTMKGMFDGASSFNQVIDGWSTHRVTDMTEMFQETAHFNQPIGSWNTLKVFKMRHLFKGASRFNQPIGAWNTCRVSDMTGLFQSASLFNQPVGAWNTGNVQNVTNLFNGAIRFNQPIGAWNTCTLTSLNAMFKDAVKFDQPIMIWNTSEVESMVDLFNGATRFNHPLATWNTQRVTNMMSMFRRAARFNQPTGTWNTFIVTSMGHMFEQAAQFNQPIETWNTALVRSMESMFRSAREFNQPIGAWCTRRVTFMNNMFYYAAKFNKPIGTWNTSIVANMDNVFQGAEKFNQPVGTWNTCLVETMIWMFGRATQFNQPVGAWCTRRVKNLQGMFFEAAKFDQFIGNWNTGRVTNVAAMFHQASKFNQPLGRWNMSLVIDMQRTFKSAETFNQPIEMWNTASVTRMQELFEGATRFNQPIGLWNTAQTINASSLFKDAGRFNQPLGAWNTVRVREMQHMFRNAHSFNQPIGTWTTNNAVNLVGMFLGATNFCQDLSFWSCLKSCSDAVASLSGCATTTVTHVMTWNITTTATLVGHASVDAFLVMSVSNASHFVSEPNVTILMKLLISQLLDVNISWVHIRNVSLVVEARALSVQTGGLHVDLGGNVKVRFEITIPMSGPPTITVTTIMKKIDAIDLGRANQVVSKLLKTSGILGQYYNAKIAMVVTTEVASARSKSVPSPPPVPDSPFWLIFGVLASVLCVLAFLLFGLYSRPFCYSGRSRNANISSALPVTSWSISELLSPPEHITPEMFISVCGLLTNDISGKESFFISFSSGHRDSDAEDSGPGMFYVAALLDCLGFHGVSCYASSHWTARLEKSLALLEQESTIKMFLVVETDAFYRSAHCFHEVSAAVRNGIVILRLRFEEITLDIHDWWLDMLSGDGDLSEVKTTVLHDVEMLNLVKQGICCACVRPPPPLTIRTQPELLEGLVLELKSKLLQRESHQARTVLMEQPMQRDEGREGTDEGTHQIPSNFLLQNVIGKASQNWESQQSQHDGFGFEAIPQPLSPSISQQADSTKSQHARRLLKRHYRAVRSEHPRRLIKKICHEPSKVAHRPRSKRHLDNAGKLQTHGDAAGEDCVERFIPNQGLHTTLQDEETRASVPLGQSASSRRSTNQNQEQLVAIATPGQPAWKQVPKKRETRRTRNDPNVGDLLDSNSSVPTESLAVDKEGSEPTVLPPPPSVKRPRRVLSRKRPQKENNTSLTAIASLPPTQTNCPEFPQNRCQHGVVESQRHVEVLDHCCKEGVASAGTMKTAKSSSSTTETMPSLI